MWYVFERDGAFVNAKTKPDMPYATVERMPPKPVVAGYIAVLMADVETNKVWWDLVVDTAYEPEVEVDIYDELAQAIAEGVNSI